MGRNGLTYVYTKYGEVYSGALWDEMHLENFTIIIRFSKIQEYRNLPQSEKPLKKISEYSWINAQKIKT